MARGRKAAAVEAEPVEGPWDLPRGWRWERLGDCLPLEYGKALSAKNRSGDGVHPVFGSSGPVGTHNATLTTGPTVVVGRKGSAGAVHYSATGCWPIDTAYYVRPRPGMNLRYAFHLLTHLRLGTLDQSTAIPSLSRDNYSELIVPVADEASQQRLAARIDALFAEIDEGEAALAEARAGVETYRKALLKAAVTGELTANWRAEQIASGRPQETGEQLLARILADRRARWHADPKNARKKYTEPARPDTDGLPELPEGWAWATIEQLSSSERSAISDGPFGSNLKSEHYRDAGPRVIRLQNIGKNGIFADVSAHIEHAHFEALERHHVQAGDLVVAILGDPLPRAIVIPSDVGPAMVKADCIKVRLGSLYPTGFVWAWLNCATVHHYFSNDIKGVGRPRIAMPKLKTLPVPVAPSNEAEHIVMRIAEGLALVTNALSLHSEWEERASTLRQSILAAAFRGELAA